ncbi:MAG: right-handed parallel beta-helix repeat-containing protein [Phycisphaerae bacterium]|nr:right-handed parallel beta-helix repeat-containing protein [Phycisphaerae bacterium]
MRLIPASIVLCAFIHAAGALDRLVPSQYPTIQAAINAAANGDRVVVSAGTYQGTGNRDLNPLGKAITILAADGPQVTVIDCQGSISTPRRGFNITSGTATLVIDGFTIRSGWQSNGGGIQIFGAASPTIQNCIIQSCEAGGNGGGIYVFGTGSPTIRNCNFRSNFAPYGGGFYASGSGNPLIEDSLFENNSAGDDGAGAYTINGPCRFLRCGFTMGTAQQDGSGVYVHTGGIATLTDCLFLDNIANGGSALSVFDGGQATVHGGHMTGGVAFHGGAVRVHESALTMSGTEISGNSAFEGGGIRVSGETASAHLTNVLLIENEAGLGGGLWKWGATVTIIGGEIRGNSTFEDGGAGISAHHGGLLDMRDVLIADNTTDGWPGGGGVNVDMPTRMENCTIRGNRSLAAPDGGVRITGSAAVTMRGCLVERNSSNESGGGIGIGGSATVLIEDCTIRENTATGDWFDGGGGGVKVWFDNENVTIRNCLIERNTATLGGGIFIGPGGINVIEGCTIRQNSAIDTGGIYLFGGPLTLRNSTLDGNTSEFGCGGLDVHREWENYPHAEVTDCVFRSNQGAHSGGARVSWSDRATAEFTRCLFENNISTESEGGGLTFRYSTSGTVSDCEFVGNSGRWGGGLCVSDSARVIVTDSAFRLNTTGWSGGGLLAVHGESRATVLRCEFDGNTAEQFGGGLACHYGSEVTVAGTRFTFNGTSGRGGGASNYDQRSRFTDCLFDGNYTSADGGGLYTESASRVERCTLKHNVANDGAGLSCSYGAPVINECEFSGNAATNGGAVFVYGNGSPRIDRSRIFSNAATGEGGGVYARDESRLILSNSLISHNLAGSKAGGVMLYGHGAGRMTLRNCTIADNQAPQTGGLDIFSHAPHLVENCIIRRNGPGVNLTAGPGAHMVHSSNIQGGYPGTGNIDADPLFADPDGPDNTPGNADDDYRLGPASPSIDRGTPPLSEGLDLAGSCRTTDGDDDGAPRVDMGAYEFLGAPLDCNWNGICDAIDVLDGTAADCNTNGAPDECDLASGISADCNSDGVPDECQNFGPFPGAGLAADMGTLDGSIGVADGVWFGDRFTVESWVFLRRYSHNGRLFDFSNGTPDDNVWLELSEGWSGRPRVVINVGSSWNWGGVWAPDSFPLGGWHHIALVFDEGVGRLYLDGSLWSTYSMSQRPSQVVRTMNHIGRSPWCSCDNLDGQIDEFRIWNTARTQADLQASMHTTLSGVEPGLILYFAFEEGSGTATANLAGGDPGVFTGEVSWYEPLACAPSCPADFNQDGGIDGADVDAFFAAWENGEASADVNRDGGIDGADVDTFFAAWESGGCE